MSMTLELLRADHVDSQKDHFSEAALKGAAVKFRKNPSILKQVTRGFSPNPKGIDRVTHVAYSCGALFVTLEGEAEEIVKKEGLVVAAGGYMSKGDIDPKDGVRYHDDFSLDRIALVKPEDKVE